MATELAKAYVQVLPTTKGIKENLTKEFGGAGDAAGRSAGSKIVGLIKGAIATAGIGKVLKDAISEGMELEQNLGGTEAVFGEFAKTIQAQASEAYKNMGLSASDYMATANKMGSLFQGSGLEQKKALDLTSQAMQRAADVASVMGLDMSSAMESIAGAAKGNFTMMDNLGVAMNATTISAYALEKGINFDWNTASNAEKAEIAMRMFFERTQQYAGNFARESAETLSGSMGAVKAAIQNVLGNLSLGNDIKPSLDALGETVVDFVSGNLLPMVSNILISLPAVLSTVLVSLAPSLSNAIIQTISGIAGQAKNFVKAGIDIVNALITGITEAIPEILFLMSSVPFWIVGALIDNIPTLISGAITFFSAIVEAIPQVTSSLHDNLIDNIIWPLADGLLSSLPVLISAAGEIFNSLVTELVNMAAELIDIVCVVLVDCLPQIIDAGNELFSSLADVLPTVINTIVTALPTLIQSVCSSLMGFIPQLINAGITLFSSLVAQLPTVIDTIVTALPTLVQSICDSLMSLLPQIIDAGITFLTSLIQELPTIINTIVLALPGIITSIVGSLLGMIPQIVNCGVQLLVSLVQALPDIVYAIVNVLPVIIASIISTLVGLLPELIQCGIDLFVSLVAALPTIIIAIVAVIPQIINSIIRALVDSIPLVIQCGIDLLVSLIGALPEIIVSLVSAMPTIITSIINALLDNIPLLVSSGIDLFVSLIKALPQIIKTIVKAVPQIITSIINAFKNGFSKMLEVGKNLLEGLWNGIKNAKDWIINKIKSVCSNILDSIKDFFGIHSPATTTEWMGEMLDKGLANGLEGNTKPIQNAIDDITKMTTGTLESDLAVNAALGVSTSSAATNKLDKLISIVTALGEKVEKMQIVLDSGAVVGGISAKMDEALGINNTFAVRGVAR